MQSLGGTAVAGWVQNLFEYVDFATFLRLRRVCKVWAAASLKNQSHWIRWLQHHGKTKRTYSNHTYEACDDPECTLPYHFKVVGRMPKILKTMPLPNQVFRTGLERIEKRTASTLCALSKAVNGHEFSLSLLMPNYRVALAQHKAVAKDLNSMKDLLNTRKRRKINISKQEDE